jgi:hypothetical protein
MAAWPGGAEPLPCPLALPPRDYRAPDRRWPHNRTAGAVARAGLMRALIRIARPCGFRADALAGGGLGHGCAAFHLAGAGARGGKPMGQCAAAGQNTRALRWPIWRWAGGGGGAGGPDALNLALSPAAAAAAAAADFRPGRADLCAGPDLTLWLGYGAAVQDRDGDAGDLFPCHIGVFRWADAAARAIWPIWRTMMQATPLRRLMLPATAACPARAGIGAAAGAGLCALCGDHRRMGGILARAGAI